MFENATNKCDLHIHSTFSDSDQTLESIFLSAKENDLSCISITDHDTTSGIKCARSLSRRVGIELIDGIEISAHKDETEIHILGYFIDSENRKFQNALEDVRELRKKRLIAMVKRLSALGLAVDCDEILEGIGDAIATRLHLGLYLVKKKIVGNLWEAFKKYLSCGKPAYIGRFKFSVKEAIELIKDSGGLAFIAHPRYITDRAWIKEFANYGADGLEVVYPCLSAAKMASFSDIADELGLIKSGGSDAHGTYKEYTKVGGVSIPYSWVLKMKERLCLV
ncbi:MAG: PHP domain-containing protein [Candidatus Omnitrophica bacterium]|nr:PHP domain-containing protein [Candidatus Omnitrophota bacterium]